MADRYSNEAARASGSDADDEGPDPDSIEAIRVTLALLRETWRHRDPSSIDRALASVDDRLAMLDVQLEDYSAIVELFGPSGARAVIAAARKLGPTTEGA